jgi:hypothetical protein
VCESRSRKVEAMDGEMKTKGWRSEEMKKREREEE